MKEKFIEQLEKEAKNLIEYAEDEKFKGYDIGFSLINKVEDKKSIVYAFSNIDSEGVMVKPFVDKEEDKTWGFSDWAFNSDEDLFESLEEEYELASMTMELHYNIWCSLEELYPEDIEYKEGVQEYLKYCKENNITKEAIEKATELKLEIDVMDFYEDKKVSNKNLTENKDEIDI